MLSLYETLLTRTSKNTLGSKLAELITRALSEIGWDKTDSPLCDREGLRNAVNSGSCREEPQICVRFWEDFWNLQEGYEADSPTDVSYTSVCSTGKKQGEMEIMVQLIN